MMLVNFGYNPWSRYWKRNQTLFYLLARSGMVASAQFVNPALWLGDIARAPVRFAARLGTYPFRKTLDGNILVTTPLCLPWTRKSAFCARAGAALNDLLVPRGGNSVVLMVNDLQADPELVRSFREKAALTIFDWSDDFVEFSRDPEERMVCRERCEYWCRNADVVLTINEDLRRRAKAAGGDAHVVRNATNFFTFPARESAAAKRIRGLGRVVVGYLGWLNGLRLDLGLIGHIARQRPAYQFVFMGPQSEAHPLGREIPELPNVHLLAPVPYDEYPACLEALDACMLPNLINDHTNGNDPIKIYDYLASGRPVVSTRTAGTAPFAGMLSLADAPDSFLELLDAAVAENDAAAAARRTEAGRQNSWQERFREVEAILRPRLARGRETR